MLDVTSNSDQRVPVTITQMSHHKNHAWNGNGLHPTQGKRPHGDCRIPDMATHQKADSTSVHKILQETDDLVEPALVEHVHMIIAVPSGRYQTGGLHLPDCLVD